MRILTTGLYLDSEPRYAEYSGTSAAATYVSTGAALVFALNPTWTSQKVVQHLLALQLRFDAKLWPSSG